MALATHDRSEPAPITIEDRRLYFLALHLAGWQKNLYFCSNDPSDGAERFDVLCQQVERIGRLASSMGDFVDRVTDLFRESGFLRIQK